MGDDKISKNSKTEFGTLIEEFSLSITPDTQWIQKPHLKELCDTVKRVSSISTQGWQQKVYLLIFEKKTACFHHNMMHNMLASEK